MADDVDPRFDPQYQRGYDPARHGTAPDVTADQRARAADPADSADDLPPRRNPFLIALPVLAAAFLGGAGYLIWRFASAFRAMMSGPTSIEDSIVYSLTSMLMPALVVGGLLCVTLWLALLALPGMRRG